MGAGALITGTASWWNIVGLPTGGQTERRYTVAELNAVLLRMQRLQETLGALRAQWPV